MQAVRPDTMRPGAVIGEVKFSPAPAAAKPALQWQRFKYPQSLYKYAALLATLVLILWSLDYLNIDIGRLPGIFGRIGEVLATRYFPPKMSRVLHPDYLAAVLETLKMTYLATLVGILAAVPLSWLRLPT